MRIALDDGAYMPVRGHDTDAGMDLKTPIAFIVEPHSSQIIDTGVHIELPPNTVGMLKSKSGLNVKYGITSEGVIDVGYTGSIVAKLYNNGDEPVAFDAGNKITQLVILPIVIPDELEVAESLEKTERGNNGFGSTGK
jgi:dUTP pyrophosphatase